MFEVIEGYVNILATKPTFADAKAYVESLGVAHMEDDPNYVDCADALLTDGRVVAIQPVGFKL
jgi:hypothetical protein